MPVTPNPQSIVTVIENKVQNEKSGNLSTWLAAQWRPILAEFLATVLLVLFGCMSSIPLEGYSPQPPLNAPLGFGFAVVFNIQIFGHISGAHINPAVTLAAVISGVCSVALGIAYVIAQCVGAIVGYGILMTVSPIDLAVDGVCLTLPHPNYTLFQALGVEIALTSALAFLCCAVWDPVNKSKQDSVALKFGLTIIGLSIAGGPLTGASMNPARSLGPSLWTGDWRAHWVYWAGPLIGGFLAAVIYKIIFLKKEKTIVESQ